MSPTIHHEDGYVFYFISFDLASGEPPHVHVGQGSQQPGRDAKVWLEPEAAIARRGRLGRRALRRILHIVNDRRSAFLEEWNAYKRRI
jgi:hypothetical protein